MPSVAPVVTTASGSVEGVWRAKQGPDGTVTEFATFRGIPYAKAPVGALRFAGPSLPEPWDGVRAAHDFGPTPQLYSPYTPPRIPEPSIPGTDTLSVNVTTPSPGPGAALPVLVWIHGGGFIAGSAASPWYVGESFARDGVVTVTASYRLGFEGFGWVEGATNNRGVLDWIAALEWVQENIAAFGGDPARVTIAGQSAGGAAVMRLLTMPAVQHLFRAAMPISPGDPSVSIARARRAAGRVAGAVGATPRLESMAEVDPLALFDARDHFTPRAQDLLTRLAIRAFRPMLPGPTVDGELIEQQCGRRARCRCWRRQDAVHGLYCPRVQRVNAAVRAALAGHSSARGARARGVPAALADSLAAAAGGDTAWAVGQAITDATFRCHVANWALLRAGASAPTWVYDFRWESQSPTVHGAAHCVDVPFGFDILGEPGVADAVGEAPPQALADVVHADWLGVVTGSGVPAADHRDRFSTVVYDAQGRSEIKRGYALERELATHLER